MTVKHLLIEASGLSDTMVAHGKVTSSLRSLKLLVCRGVGQNLSYQTASVHPAVMGTWWNEKNGEL